jgi:alpha-glucosidase
LATLPVFVRPGAILPMAPLVQSTDQQPTGPLTLRVFPGPDCSGALYQDDGTTFAYKRGEFLRMTFSCDESSDNTRLSIHVGKHQGTYPAWWRSVAIEVNGLPHDPKSVMINGHAAHFNSATGPLTIATPDNGEGLDIVIR